SVADAWYGVADAGFKAPLKKLRAIGNTYPNNIQVVASQASGIKTLADLKGMRISVGGGMWGTELSAGASLTGGGV
ncbi:TAXI family TRAP transporter solute-binding subunit, partial [Pseudomonas aeruginosa]|uniref:TAXI family TRAP transporter solute-binding subunit n=1 Tax=Pseudomonas aeruginosa TaxID=287 RepID=UPI003CC6DBD9